MALTLLAASSGTADLTALEQQVADPSEDAGWYVPTDGVDVQQPPTAGPTVVKVWSSGKAVACVQRG